ncbi:unnamed protein product [Callosobruchus maculatus]|uniref:Sulfotransferase domain-containing protein n=1 Tax=Callosobruchus maculatus TaxID=64391 RepID=A0A653C8Y0_CALMS|nr:unnamed protein product [Callosobruchus maculatus]
MFVPRLSWNDRPGKKDMPEPFRDSFAYIKKKYESGPVSMKTHLPWTLLPKEIQENLKKPKIIYVVRNCKDAAVSAYHFSKALFGYTGSREEFYNDFLSDKMIYLPYWKHVLGFWEQRHKPNVMILRYEEMIKDLPGMIRKVASFLERPLSDEQVVKLRDHLSFDSMKKNPAVNNENLIERVRKEQGREKPETGHMRRGTTWTQEMVWMIMNNLDVEGAKKILTFEFSWDNRPDKKDMPEPFRDSFAYIKKKYESGPVSMKTHVHWTLLPKEIQENLKKPKIIYVVRNCKDTAVSDYHFSKALLGYTGSRKEFYNDFLSDKSSHKDEMSPQTIRRFDQWIEANTKNTDFTVA